MIPLSSCHSLSIPSYPFMASVSPSLRLLPLYSGDCLLPPVLSTRWLLLSTQDAATVAEGGIVLCVSSPLPHTQGSWTGSVVVVASWTTSCVDCGAFITEMSRRGLHCLSQVCNDSLGNVHWIQRSHFHSYSAFLLVKSLPFHIIFPLRGKGRRFLGITTKR